MTRKTIYLNLRTPYGVETIDEFTQGENAPIETREFRIYVNQMVREYHLTNQNVYKSQRCTNEWKCN